MSDKDPVVIFKGVECVPASGEMISVTVCGECGHPDEDHIEQGDWSHCTHGQYMTKDGWMAIACNCGERVDR